MPLPNPRSGESENDFHSRCMGNAVMGKEYPDQAQRNAICYSQWRRNLQSDTEKFSSYNVLNNTYQLRTVVHQGVPHLVIPVIMMVEGVHNGSHGKLLHLAEDLGKFPGSWNGIPVTVEHPEEGYQYISANIPSIVDSQVVGRIYGTHFEDGRLKSEAWINEAKVREISPLALAYILQGKPLEVSVGVFTEDEITSGTWHDEEYVAIARNHRPDHLALLPGGQGACSWKDGCGVRTNSNKEGGNDVDDLLKVMKELNEKGYTTVQLNKESYDQIISTIRTKLDRMDDDLKIHFLEEVFDDFFVYRIQSRAGLGGEDILYKRGYNVNADESIEFTGEPTSVIRKVEYVTQTITSLKRTKGGILTMDKKTEPCCPEKVQALIQSEHTKFEEDDREWLSSLQEGQIEKLSPIIPVKAEPVVPKKEEDEQEKLVQMNKEQAIQMLKEHFADPKDFLSILPEETREQMEYGMDLHQAHRAELIQHITANTEVYTADDLKDRKTDELKKLAQAIKPKMDFSLLSGSSPKVNVVVQEALLPPGVAEKKTETAKA